jgi:hypothetical protein
MNKWDLDQWKGLIVGLGCVCIIMLGLEIAKQGGFKEFFKNIFRRK